MTHAVPHLRLPVILVILAGAFLGIFCGSFYALFHDLPQINSLKLFRPSAVTRIYSSDNILLASLFRHQREPIPIAQIPDDLIRALICTEDRNFFSHPGVDLKGIARAIIHDIKTGSYEQGASTITQQLAKTLFFSSEKSISRKVKEMLVTFQIERRYSKREILELYLNQIYFGSGAYGIEAAASAYFGKHAQDLTLPESALIAGLPKAPSRYSPLNDPERAKHRRNVVLSLMAETNTITREVYEQAIADSMALSPADKPSSLAPHFIDYVLDGLSDLGIDDIYTRGYTIYTTLDYSHQMRAERAVAKGIAAIKTRMTASGISDPKPESALVAIDVNTGGILSLVGGSNPVQGTFNRVTDARRQPGSAFKPFVYAAAISQGFSQSMLIPDAPLAFDSASNRDWEPGNFSGSYLGEIPLRKALALSKNTPAIRIAQQVGPAAIIRLSRQAGIISPLTFDLSLALGTSEVTLLELTAAYSLFPNQGNWSPPFAIESIKDMSGNNVYQHHHEKQAVVTRQTAAIVTDMLKAVISEGTGRKALVLKTELAGKTGTTDQFKDALFIGFSSSVAAGVWVGRDNAQTLGKNETGSRAALPIWIDYMKQPEGKQPSRFFDIPDGTEVLYMDPDTGTTTKYQGSGTVRALFLKKDI